jgi:glycosyltransferase involved in cell wall biosynthesis
MIYVMVENLSGSVIRSQVLMPLMEIAQQLDLDIDLLAMERQHVWEQRKCLEPLRRELESQRVRLHVFLHHGSRHPITYLNLLRMFLALLGLLVANQGRVIMARNFHSAFLSVPFRLFPKSRLLLDLRGAFVHELVLRGTVREGGIVHRALTWMERQSFSFSDHILCVSERLVRYVTQTLGGEKATSVIPCCVAPEFFTLNEHRQRALAQSLDLLDKFVVVYAGSLTSWNLFAPMLDIFTTIHREQRDAHFLFMTSAVDEAESAFRERGFPKKCYTVMSVPHQEIKNYIALGDLALLLREDNLVNRVASPVKLGEYMACGVPVCITPYVGDLSDLVAQYRTGIVLDLSDSACGEQLSAFVPDVRQNREQYRRSYFDRRRYCQVYRKLVWRGR